MIQFNLVPSVKLEYIKARRAKRLTMAAAIIIGGVSLSIFLLLLVNVNVVQKKHISNLSGEIEQNTKKLQEIEDIDKVLTVQNQLNVLTGLHEQKPAADRVLDYLQQITPQQASVTETSANFDEMTFTINGSANNLVTVNKFVDTLKFTKYTVDNAPEQLNAFSEVVLTSFSVDDNEATFQIDFKYDPIIFDNTKKANLIIPNIISTRSQTQKPSEDLFQEPTNPEGTQ